MENLRVTEWKRFGKHRLYVNRNDAKRTAVAWFDAETGHVEIMDEDFRRAATALIAEWITSNHRAPEPGSERSARPARPAERPQYARTVPYLPVLTPEDDLVFNPPGAQLMQKIRELEPGPFRRWLIRLLHLPTGAETWRAGLEGERICATALDALRSAGWCTLHSVPTPGTADIDHVAIGPPGVFTINTKHKPGAKIWVGTDTIRVNGDRTEFVRNSLSEAKRVKRVLSHWCGYPVEVVPVVAVVGAERIKFKDPSRTSAVMVLDATRADRVLSALPVRLTDDQVRGISTVARHRQVWTSGPDRGRTA